MTNFLKKTFRVSVISPVHIGSVENWVKNIHFTSDSGQTQIFDVKNSISDNIAEIHTPVSPSPLKLIQDGSKPVSVFPSMIYANSIARSARTAQGTPYIPGNSLKGFYHTALMHAASRQNQSITIDMPELRFSDIEFPAKSIAVTETKKLNLTSEKSFGWKQFGRENVTIQNPQKATSQYVEAFNISEFSLSSITIKADTHDVEKLETLWAQTRDYINTLSNAIIQQEKTFYDRISMKECFAFYVSLQEKLRTLSNGFFMCIGWGIGWNARVGALHTLQETDRIRQQHDMGKMDRPCPSCSQSLKVDRFDPHKLFCIKCKKAYPAHSVVIKLFPVFPKSRVLAIEKSLPRYPFGWLRFDESPLLEKVRNPETGSLDIRIRQKTTTVIKTPFLSPEEYPETFSQTKHFKKKIKIDNRGSFPTRFNVFLNKVAELEFVLAIEGDEIINNLDIMQAYPFENPGEIRFVFSDEGKGIKLKIRIGANAEAQYNFAVNRIWEIIDSLWQEK
jgi:CRISPR/Cas system CSM-associated protein Csm5 (group 7 of RAMP superfamily)